MRRGPRAAAALIGIMSASTLVGGSEASAGPNTLTLTFRVVSATLPNGSVAKGCAELGWMYPAVGMPTDGQIKGVCDGGFADEDHAAGTVTVTFELPDTPDPARWWIDCWKAPGGYVWQDPPAACGTGGLAGAPMEFVLTERVMKLIAISG